MHVIESCIGTFLKGLWSVRKRNTLTSDLFVLCSRRTCKLDVFSPQITTKFSKSSKKRSKDRERNSVISASDLPHGNSSALSRVKTRPEAVFVDHPSHFNALSFGYLTNTIVTKVTPREKCFLNYNEN